MVMGIEAGERQVTEPEQLKAELEQALAAGELVVVCWEPGCTMHHLPHWQEHQWVSRERLPGYRNYSHGICRWHYQACRAEISRFAAERSAICQTQRALLTVT